MYLLQSLGRQRSLKFCRNPKTGCIKYLGDAVLRALIGWRKKCMAYIVPYVPYLFSVLYCFLLDRSLPCIHPRPPVLECGLPHSLYLFYEDHFDIILSNHCRTLYTKLQVFNLLF
ncbi:hypothetical protein GDO81_006875 [Engystomops pustulosus]|uniref:Uncharacterized protein n=1 Tax=Engystomops pustulosus TaxID=76066 RepID=A0AAV7D1M9_ENGPU|nr:hypothetical protein GDO81_006875 [Engystomops pustulosus]